MHETNKILQVKYASIKNKTFQNKSDKEAPQLAIVSISSSLVSSTLILIVHVLFPNNKKLLAIRFHCLL